MIKRQRINEIRKYVESHQVASFENLSAEFNVSLNTIRRDAESLVQQELVKKVHGGIAVPESGLSKYEEREGHNEAAKKAIGRAAADLVEEGDIIFIDTGTTTVWMAPFLENKKITVLTNNLHFINEAKEASDLTIISTGGLFDPSTHSFISIDNIEGITSYNIDKAFMAATGISSERSITHASPLENNIKKAVVQKSSRTYILADHSKFGNKALMTFALFNEIEAVITDDVSSKEIEVLLNESHVKIHKTDENENMEE
ncbi:DeoR family transcriptional regulator [Sinobaca qinghaiensis]|uniref:DeoR family transcriptional regulator n=1 Tax=Sinobaca qinghaiensis TaxID=342944 RepID=A0A419UWX3_9BACL|nr:DeoR family transcriptional regulator [Sinobaca qinghaiensis]